MSNRSLSAGKSVGRWKVGKRSTRELKIGMAVYVVTQYNGTVLAEIVEEVVPGKMFVTIDLVGTRRTVLQSEIL